MYQAILFDVDGTILDTEKAVLHSLQSVLEEAGHFYTQEELRFALGIPGEKAIQRLNLLNADEILAKWMEQELQMVDEVRLFDGIEALLPQIPESAVVTSKNSYEMEKGFYPFGIGEHFNAIVCASDTVNHKPHPEPLLKAMELLARNPGEVLYIDDSPYDMACAHSAGADFGLALWGAKSEKGFEEAEHAFRRPSEILAHVAIQNE
ncbi:HAD family hydrolase [Listeria valentina]|uniref:HAD family hydrolase n=1 Tax=Listeria valentina TaxID=2705293 RepID=UPI0014307B92|nr:HAD family hydrolase [Listeria valentina]